LGILKLDIGNEVWQKEDVVVIIELETSFLLVASPLIEAKVNRKKGERI